MLTMEQTVAPKKLTDLTHRDLSWFARRVQRGQKEIFTEIVTVTPDIARRLLETNKDNRKINEAQVRQIADDIEHGRYVLNGETIVLSKEGLLNDGQHRLEGVVRANKPIQTAMMFGVDRKSRFTVDMGRARRTSEFLAMQGVVNYVGCAATSSLLTLYLSGAYIDSKEITRQAAIDTYKQSRAEIDDAVSWVRGHKLLRSAGVAPLSVAYLILGRLDAAKRNTFFDSLALGADLAIDSPILALRARILTISAEKLRMHHKLELIFRHWKAWVQKDAIKRRLNVLGSYPKLVK